MESSSSDRFFFLQYKEFDDSIEDDARLQILEPNHLDLDDLSMFFSPGRFLKQKSPCRVLFSAFILSRRWISAYSFSLWPNKVEDIEKRWILALYEEERR
ncbi:hypothetical protein BT93_G1475 [Corymbia citriodora subsp. variegata]|nr:hypothetical protein BT93_G1475 [Corymbia citriodora subsp. variegata]